MAVQPLALRGVSNPHRYGQRSFPHVSYPTEVCVSNPHRYGQRWATFLRISGAERGFKPS